MERKATAGKGGEARAGQKFTLEIRPQHVWGQSNNNHAHSTYRHSTLASESYFPSIAVSPYSTPLFKFPISLTLPLQLSSDHFASYSFRKIKANQERTSSFPQPQISNLPSFVFYIFCATTMTCICLICCHYGRSIPGLKASPAACALDHFPFLPSLEKSPRSISFSLYIQLYLGISRLSNVLHWPHSPLPLLSQVAYGLHFFTLHSLLTLFQMSLGSHSSQDCSCQDQREPPYCWILWLPRCRSFCLCGSFSSSTWPRNEGS